MRSLRISIAVITSVLISLGIIMIYSSSGIYAMHELGDGLYFLKRHLIFLVIGFLGALVTMAIDYRDLQKYSKPLLIIAVVMLILVLIPHIGKSSYGARRWFKLGAINFQPSEYAKMAMLIYTADFLTRKQNMLKNFFKGFFPLLMVMGIVCALILKQPDFGRTLLIAAIVMLSFYIAGGRTRYMAFLGVLALPAFYFLVVNVPYRWTRIVTFLDPWSDPQGTGFQLTQAQIAFGSGGLCGVGLGKSLQKLFYLPAAHTDFILSIIGEELGFFVAFGVICLFICLIWQGARIAKRVSDPFGYFLSIGIVAMLGLQAMVNVGVSMGALPTKGLPLPFISYGGSALIFQMMAVGLLLNISRIHDIYPSSH